MKAIVIDKAGPHEVLQLKGIKSPELENNQCLIKVSHSGINYADTIIRQGLYASARHYVGWPITPGFEVSGVVENIAEGVKKFKKGDRVMAITRFGGYSEYVAIPEDQIMVIPEHWTNAQAAGFMATHMTAYHALYQIFLWRPQSNILVHSAAGGMGTALCQLAKINNARVLGIVGNESKVKTASRYGADKVVVRKNNDYWKEIDRWSPEGFDIIMDGAGPDTLKKGYERLKPMGKLVSYGFHSMFSTSSKRTNWLKLVYQYFRVPKYDPLDMVEKNKSVIGFNVSFLFEFPELKSENSVQLDSWIKDCTIQPSSVKEYSIENIIDAHKDLESGNTVGKLVLAW